MGRYPFLTELNRCVKEWKPYYSEASLWELDRKLRMIARELDGMRQAGTIGTTDPTKIGEAEVGALLVLWKQRGLDPTTQHNYLRFLGYFLTECGNTVIERMRRRRRNLPRPVSDKELVALTWEQLRRIWATCDSMTGWRGDVARFIFRVYPFTGLRNKELRLAHLEDLDTKLWILKVRHPKGEGSWGKQRTTLFPPPLREPTLNFLRTRAEWLAVQGIAEVVPLIPTPAMGSRTEPSAYTNHGFEAIKLEVERRSGVRFKIKDLRSTCAQLLKDLGVGIESVSKQLGHASTRTTERHYARIRDSAVQEEITKAWERAVSQTAD